MKLKKSILWVIIVLIIVTLIVMLVLGYLGIAPDVGIAGYCKSSLGGFCAP
jgi:hypothetical protein